MKHRDRSQRILLLLFLVWPVMTHAGFKLHCQGDGDPVYLIGGGPGFTTWNLQPVQQYLANHKRVCRWDMRGIGDNAGLEISSRYTALSQWLHDMNELLPSEPVTLWGHSWGALQVLLFARDYPQRVSHIVLSNPVDPALRSHEHIEQKRFNHPSPQDELALEDIDTPAEVLYRLQSKIASYFFDADKGWAYAKTFGKQDMDNALNIRIWDDYRRSLLTDSDVTQLANKVRGVIYCEQDVLMPEALTEYQRLLPDSQHHVIKNCGHFPWEEDPSSYYEVLSLLID